MSDDLPLSINLVSIKVLDIDISINHMLDVSSVDISPISPSIFRSFLEEKRLINEEPIESKYLCKKTISFISCGYR
jgi:hypothetical protein